MAMMDLRLSESAFWDLTPRLFRSLLDRQREMRDLEHQRADLRAGVIASVIANTMGGKKRGGGAWAAKDFFRFEQPDRRAARRQPAKQSQVATEAGWVAWARAMGVQPPAGLVIGGRRD